MNTKEETLDFIIDEIFELDDPEIGQERWEQIETFINFHLNEADTLAHLVMNGKIDGDKPGAMIYILTRLHLIKIDIGSEYIQSDCLPLSTLIGIGRRLIDNEEIELSMAFLHMSLGLKYSQDLKNITEFFQKIDKQGQ